MSQWLQIFFPSVTLQQNKGIHNLYLQQPYETITDAHFLGLFGLYVLKTTQPMEPTVLSSIAS
jgi:hypothetical protein